MKIKKVMNMFVDTANGTVQGQLTVSCTGVDYYSFKGIRYAETPVGSLRFQVIMEFCIYITHIPRLARYKK